MAEQTKTAAPAQTHYPATPLAIAALFLGWLVPGGGHFLQRRWIRGALLATSVVAMFTIGLLMDGRVYPAEPR